MSKGSAGIPALHLTTLNKLIDMTPNPGSLFFSNLFPSKQYESDQIEWEIEYGSYGMSPFIAPGSIAPVIGGDGIGYGRASCAMMAEKTFLDELLLNNLRKVGTDRVRETAESQLAKRFNKLRVRAANRREWMMAKMLTEGAISYQDTRGLKISVSYGIPAQNLVTLTGNSVWGTGSERNPSKDLFDMQKLLSDEYGYTPTHYLMNTTTKSLLMFDTKIADLAKKSAFDIGNPMGAQSTRVIMDLLGIGNLTIYDDTFEVEQYLTAAVVGSSTTTVYVEDASDLEVGGKVRFIDMRDPRSWETKAITAVDKVNNTFTIATAPTKSYAASRDKIVMRKKYIPDNKILMFNPMANGTPIAEMFEAPHGLARRWGMASDTWDVKDPEGTWLKIQDKCFPVLYNPENIAVLTVA